MVSWRMQWITGFIAIASLSQPLAAQFGELPPNHVNRLALEGVRGEVVFYVLTDSTALVTYVPAGLQLVTLQRIASRDTVTAQFLSSRPYLKTAVPGTLLFASLDSLTIDAKAPTPWLLAAWWVPLRSSESVDARARGETWLQVAAWASDTAVVRLLRPQWPELRSAAVSFERIENGEWSVALALPDGRILGRCRPSGDRNPGNYPLPQYSTVWNTGPQPVSFTLYTYYGHQNQECVGELSAEGSGVLVTAVMRSPRELVPWMKPSLQDGWHARAGLYRH
jgi:hypothetical protein